MKHSKLLFAIFTLFLLLGTTNSAFAQPGQNQRPNKGKVTQLKIAYFTKELDLTTEQAEKFWPLYNEMTDKIRDKKKAGRQAASQLKDNSEYIKNRYLENIELSTRFLDEQIKMQTSAMHSFENFVNIMMDSYQKSLSQINRFFDSSK